MVFAMISFLCQDKFILISRQEKNLKSAAQGLITLATYGVGMLVGFWIAGQVVDANILADASHGWQDVWLFPALFAAGVFVIFALLFKDEKVEYKE